MVEVTNDSQYQSEHANFVNHYILQGTQYKYESGVKRDTYNTKKANFNLNLGEFSVDEDLKSHQE